MTDLDYLAKALASPNQSGKSELVTEYENALAGFFRSPHAIAVNSGSAAIQVALHTLGACVGTRVLVSAAAPLPSLLPLLATGATPLFVDSNPDNPGMNANALKLALLSSDKIAAAMEVPLWGYPQDYTAIMRILEDAKIPLIEDAAQAHGANTSDGFVGTVGIAGCFSTHQKKLLSTGEGGFILTHCEELAVKMRQYSRLGNLDGKSSGMNFKPSAFTASIGLSRLVRLNENIAARRTTAHSIFSALPMPLRSEMPHIGTPNGYNLVLWLPELASSSAQLHSGLAKAGYGTDVHKYNYRCGYDHPLFQHLKASCPNANNLISQLIQLPTDQVEVSNLITTIEQVLKP